LICLIQEDKSLEDIAGEDFDNNLEFVSVWADYMVAINWMRKNNNKWVVTYNGKIWVEKILQYKTND
jgi:hypothetical protein